MDEITRNRRREALRALHQLLLHILPAEPSWLSVFRGMRRARSSGMGKGLRSLHGTAASSGTDLVDVAMDVSALQLQGAFVLLSCFFVGGVGGVCARVFGVVVVKVGGVCGVEVPGDDFCSPLFLLLVSFGGHWIFGGVDIVEYVRGMVRCAIGRERSIQCSVFVVQSVVVLKSLQIMNDEGKLYAPCLVSPVLSCPGPMFRPRQLV